MGNHANTGPTSTARVIAALAELIDALERRAPHIERSGETQIAQAAAKLRSEAERRINELRRGGPGGHDADLVDAVMNDDGGPARKE